MEPYKTVLFDFDYTLADSSAGAVECINSALLRMRLPTVPAERARATIGLSLQDTFAELTGGRQIERCAEFASLFVERADKVMADLTTMFAGVAPMVDRLTSHGRTVGIVSTKFRYRIEAILRREGLRDAFAVIVGGEDVAAHKPHPAGLLSALARLECPPERGLYVGDSVVDAEAAQRAAMPFVAVLSGVTPAAAFDESAAVAMLPDVSGVPGLLARLNSKT